MILFTLEDADEELRGRLVATKAAIEQIDTLAAEEWTRDETVERMRAFYEYRKRRLGGRAGTLDDDEGIEDRSLAYQQMVQIVDPLRVLLRPGLRLRAGRSAPEW